MSLPTPAAHVLGRCAFVLLAWGSTCAAAGGLDRTAQSLSPLFEKGRYVGVDGYYSRPSVQGRDAMGFSTGDVAPSYGQWGLSYKQDLSPQLSMALMLTRPCP